MRQAILILSLLGLVGCSDTYSPTQRAVGGGLLGGAGGAAIGGLAGGGKGALIGGGLGVPLVAQWPAQRPRHSRLTGRTAAVVVADTTDRSERGPRRSGFRRGTAAVVLAATLLVCPASGALPKPIPPSQLPHSTFSASD